MEVNGNIKNILLSVIIPTRNRPELLLRALSSVAVQNFSGLEICVVDNNSDEQLSERVQNAVYQFKERFPAISWLYLHSAKPFASGARNDGMQAVVGKYICFLDDDDELLPESLKIRYQEISTADDIALLYCGGFSKIYPYPFKMYRYYRYNKLKHKDKLVMMSCSSIIINMAIFEKHHLVFDEEQSRMDDYDICRRLIELNLRVKSIPQPLVLIHLHPETRISSNALNNYDFKFALEKRWGNSVDEVIYSYSEGLFIWRKCFGIESKSYKEITTLLNQDFNREVSSAFKIKYFLISISPKLFLGFYHLAIALSQFYKNNIES